MRNLAPRPTTAPDRRLAEGGAAIPIVLFAIVAAIAAIAAAALLVNIVENKQEAKNPFFRVVEITDDIDDPAVWGKNFPLQYDLYRRTVDQVRTRFGGSRGGAAHADRGRPALAWWRSPRLEEDPRLKTMWAGYAFAADFREERGHAYMLDDQTFTERQQVVKQPGTCMQLPRLGVHALQASSATATSSRASRRSTR